MDGECRKLCLDLCSGLGGFSQAFVDVGWDVLRIDNDSRFAAVPCTVIADVCDVDAILRLVGDRKVTVILASPPCTAFSVASIPWHWKDKIPDMAVVDGLRLLTACIEIISKVKPRYWFLENPRGMLRRLIGKPRTTIRLSDYGSRWKKPTDLWGNIRLPLLDAMMVWEKAPRGSKTSGVQGTRDPAKCAHMPYGLSQAILEAVS